MMRSMFSGVSGLRIHQTKMDVIAHNIANVNTVGYKSSRVTFSETFSQTVSGASQANPVFQRGGVNPKQIGLGGNVASIDKLMTTGAAQRTDEALDLMIQGDGFFIVSDSSGYYFTRAGNFTLDEEGNLVNSAGLMVMGWDRVRNTTTGLWEIEKSAVKSIQITGDKEYSPPVPTSFIDMEGNFNADTNPEHLTKMEFYDTVGNRYVVDVKYTYNTTTQIWTQAMSNVAYVNGETDKPINLTITKTATSADILFGSRPAAGTSVTPEFVDTGVTLGFDTGGNIIGVGVNDAAPTPPVAPATKGTTLVTYNLTATAGVLQPNALFGNKGDGKIGLEFTKVTGFANDTADAKAVKRNGNKPGNLTGMTVGSDGIITGRYSNGDVFILAQIPVARFKNPAGLEKAGNNLFVATANSGDFDGVGTEVQEGGGSMLGGVLEMANVDLGSEFTEMITTQRGFQANSRTITVSDEMLSELVNLKR